MPANYVLLGEITVSTSVASVTFSNIPQTGYTDLVMKMSARSNRADLSDGIVISPNGSTANATQILLFGNGTSAGSTPLTLIVGGISTGANDTSETFGNSELYIPNYNSTTTFKSMSSDGVNENNATTAFQGLRALLWSNNSAITSLVITPQVGTAWVANSTFYLYGVAALGTTPVIAPKATGGDIITNDGTYWYHAFLSSGIFTPSTTLSCDVLQIAGGGGGGSRAGGGGGAGGISYLTSQSVSATNQIVTVGSGGTGNGRSGRASNGFNSQFASLTAAVGGGYGASAIGSVVGGAGGSGGGGSNGAGGVGGSATSGQGFAGGNSNPTSFDAGGGGGAGAVGANASASGLGSGSGAGGTGVNTYSSWASATGTGISGFYAGGGGGGSFGSSNHGAGGAGGGGTGADTAPTNGTANTGGGAGGAGNSANSDGTPVGANGGSGIVIVRYTVA
jgi:hypothetical protein